MLVIFDCDGVLVDSEPLANASFSQALKASGLDWSVEETMQRLMGLSLKFAIEICEAELGHKLPDDFLEKMQAVTYRNFRDAPLKPVAGVREAVLALQAAGVATCVASSGALEKMRGDTKCCVTFGDARQASRSKPPCGAVRTATCFCALSLPAWAARARSAYASLWLFGRPSPRNASSACRTEGNSDS